MSLGERTFRGYPWLLCLFAHSLLSLASPWSLQRLSTRYACHTAACMFAKCTMLLLHRCVSAAAQCFDYTSVGLHCLLHTVAVHSEEMCRACTSTS